MTYNQTYDRYRAAFEDALMRRYLTPDGKYGTLFSAMEYSVKAGGKRLRPVLTLSAAEMCGGSIDSALSFAAAMELIHTYSLIHDDLPCMDDDDLRRGKPTAHKVYGEAVAVLAGDALHSLAYEILFKHITAAPYKYNITAAKLIADSAGSAGMIGGQCADVESEKRQDSSYKDKNEQKELLKFIHINKTAKLISAAICSGALSANADDATLGALTVFGEKLGLLFQLTDDILDVTGSQSLLGKTVGKDEKNNKLTYPKVYGLQESRRLAGELGHSAKAALESLGSGFRFYAELVDKVVSRDM